MSPFDIIIVTNSPGELSAYVRPTVEEISKKAPQARVILVFTPCQYATGRELEEARTFKGIHEIVIQQDYRRWILRNRPPQGINFNQKGIVLYLGGDLLHAKLIAGRLKYPAIAYSEKLTNWQKNFKLFMVPDEFTRENFIKRKVPDEKIKVIGDLMVDSVPKNINKEAVLGRWKVNANNPIISFLPGSRKFQISYMLPLFLKTIEIIRKIIPEAQFLFILSPYMNEDSVKKYLGNEGIIYSQGDSRFIQSKNGTRALIVKQNQLETIASSGLVMTLPGTNTAQISALGTPMVIAFPVNKAHRIPFEGLGDLILKIPVIGIILKKISIFIIDKKTKFYALPNIKAGREIVPEVRGSIIPKEIAARAIQCLKNKTWLKETSIELKKVMGPAGASGVIADEILKQMEKN